MTDFLTEPRRTSAPIHFVANLATFGAAPALWTANGAITYLELHEHVQAAAAALPRDRTLVLIEGANRVETIVAYLAALAGGHVVALTPPTATVSVAQTFDPNVVFRAHSSPLAPDIRHLRSTDLHPDLALLLTTSGTTGSPKLVRLSQENLDTNAQAIASYLQLSEHDRGITALPLHYCYGLSVLHSHLAVGASVVVSDLSVAEPCFWTTFVDHGVTGLAGVPYTFELLEAAGFGERHLPSLRYVTQAGGRLDPATVRHYAQLGQRRGWDLYVMYGQTEATARMAYLPPDLATDAPESIGLAIPGGSFRIVEPDAAGAGELAYRGPNVMLGYATNPDDLAIGPTLDELFTGDLATRGPDGLVRIVGRTSRFLKLFGLRVDLDAVEAHATARGFDAVACTGSDTRLVCAVRGDDATAGLLHRELVAHLGLPSGSIGVVLVDHVPRLANGKCDYAAIAALDTDVWSSEHCVATSDVRSILALTTRRRRDQIPADATFVSLGGDSLSYVEVAARLDGILGPLPSAWHLVPVDQLELLAANHAPKARPQRTARIETNVALRAVAMILIVGSHTRLFAIQGGAHVLLAVAGYNFARFGLRHSDSTEHLRRTWRIVARIAVPTWVWLAFQFTYAEPFSWPRALLVNNYAGTGLWEYWYIEAIIQLLILVSLPFAFTSVRRLEQRRPFRFPVAVLTAAVAIRWARPDLGYDELLYRPDTLLWLFVLGWAAQRAEGPWRRGLVVLLGGCGAWGYFDSTNRATIAVAGLVALIFMSHVVVPRIFARPLAVIASSSLALFLVEWAFVPIADSWSPIAAFALAFATGIALTAVVSRLVRWWQAQASTFI